MTNTNTPHDALSEDLRSRLRAEFEASPELRAEFISVEGYVAFKKAEAEGRVRILHV